MWKINFDVAVSITTTRLYNNLIEIESFVVKTIQIRINLEN